MLAPVIPDPRNPGSALRPVSELAEIDMSRPPYATIGFLRAVQMAVRKQGPLLHLRFDDDEDKVLLGDAAFGDAWRRNSRYLVKDVDEYPAPASLVRMFLDNNLATAHEGEEWEDKRREFSPLVRYKLISYADAVEVAAEELIRGLQSTCQDPPSLWSLCATWSAQTVCYPMMGFGVSDEMALDMVNGLRSGLFHLLQQVPSSSRDELLHDKELLRLRAQMSRMVQDAIAMCRDGDENMVGTLLDARGHSRGAAPTEARHSRDLSWHLNTAPAALAAVRESLRINPVLPFIERKAGADLDLNGIAVPRGTTVVFSPWVVQRDARNWADPLSFRIDRFAAGARVDLSRWFPFGLGHRACVGSNLALNQIARTVSLICRHLHLAMPETTRPSYWQPTYRVLLEPREDGGMLTTSLRS